MVIMTISPFVFMTFWRDAEGGFAMIEECKNTYFKGKNLRLAKDCYLYRKINNKSGSNSWFTFSNNETIMVFRNFFTD